MSRMNSDQLHSSTLRIYSNLMDEFNPGLKKLVSLGNSYVRAFKALAETSEAYFSALSKIGEKAFYTVSSRSLGDVLLQISESQRRLTLELDGVFRWFSAEVLQEMDNNVRLDKDYISGSRNQYEMEVHNQEAALERRLSRGNYKDCSEYVEFLRESHGEALKEEERRYRFLAEKHCAMIQSIGQLMDKIGGSLQQRGDTWTEEVNATRQPEARRPAAVENTVRQEETRRSREEPPLGRIPSRAPSPQGSIYRSAADSVGGGGAGGRSTRALVSHQPTGSNPTLLPFTRGEIITVMVQQPRNGWLYGRADDSSRQGWFPAAFVEPVDDPFKSTSSSNSTLRSSSSMSNLFDQRGSSSYSGAAPPPAPPPPPPLSQMSSNKHSDMQLNTQNWSTPKRNDESNSHNKKRSQQHASQPELFPRGTNPFATVKLKPTTTNDRSTPQLNRM
ncbi:brain-specific angiogenesis inhibitor 1-associated protein 2-like protein 2 [Hippoglossus stenolepis]|uniref:brain-specific angiogenesis inhibitor 1-associated protein 2-like protein 2 n=1 Tax=Hippoglossus stenolepis TaxID=195615 RepID=UPI00159C893F|nr:brain-specific angiogenesis inhibitor 1-associated protein 2-like protein 2 [Hippoglossus stenolepis]